MTVSKTHLVLIPSFNTGPRLIATVREALAYWQPVWVVVDGSTDESAKDLERLRGTEPQIRVIVLAKNGGKGAAVLEGARRAQAEGFTHALVMDADGQHPADRIQDFMRVSSEHTEALVLGRPVFGPEAPQLRLQGRKLSVGMVRLEVLGGAIGDPLFGFRVYPLGPLVEVMEKITWARRYDFDPEAAVRLVWRGVPTLNVPACCRYLSREEGGVSHFHYWRDNLRMVWLHTRLITECLLLRWWSILFRRASRIA